LAHLSLELHLHRYVNDRIARDATCFDSDVRESAMQTITTHYINGTFVKSHGSEVMDIIKPTNRQVIARVTMADEQDTKRAIAAAKSALITFGRSTREERTQILRRRQRGDGHHQANQPSGDRPCNHGR
jgi:delta 1-pyrroline-5-carboxylate dehydrogenase